MKFSTSFGHERRLRAPSVRAPLLATTLGLGRGVTPPRSQFLFLGVCALRCRIRRTFFLASGSMGHSRPRLFHSLADVCLLSGALAVDRDQVELSIMSVRLHRPRCLSPVVRLLGPCLRHVEPLAACAIQGCAITHPPTHTSLSAVLCRLPSGGRGVYLAQLLGQRWHPPWTESIKHIALRRWAKVGSGPGHRK